MSSPIELYKDAYDLDYKKGDWQYAEALYKEIVENHPHSDEKEYALVHLDRIKKLKGDPGNPDYKVSRTSSGGQVFGILSFIMVIFLIGAGSAGAYMIWQQEKLNSYYGLIFQGIIDERNGSLENAAKKYEKAQAVMPNKPLAYQCSAELYLKLKDYKMAHIESKRWEITSGKVSEDLTEFRQRLKYDFQEYQGKHQ